MKPLVSILIPAYNAERWIAETLESALAQTWPNKEVIVVDDGSRDETLSIARKFESKNVSIVTQDNKGAAAARNKAFDLCQGDYIQWLDADDLLSPNKVSAQMAGAEECEDNRRLLSCPWGYFMYRPHKARFVPTPLWDSLSPVDWILRKWAGNHHMQTATWVVSRELTEAAGPWNMRLLGDDDGEYFCRVLLASNGVRFVSDAKVFYRITHSGRWSYIGQSKRKLEAHLLSRELQIGYLQAHEDSERVRAACLTYLQTSFFNFYPEHTALVERSQKLAAALGGRLRVPKLPWKYLWIQKLFGLPAAKRTRRLWNRCKSSILRSLDKILSLKDRQQVSAGEVTLRPSSVN